MLKDFYNQNKILSACLSLFGGSFLSYLILTGSTKYISGFALLLAACIFLFKSPPITKLWVTVLFISFPITLQVGGRDALTTGTLAIFSLFLWSRAKIKSTNKRPNVQTDYLVKILVILVIIACVGTMTNTPAGYWGPATRSFINFISSVLLFLTVIQSGAFLEFSYREKDYIEKLITIIIIIVITLILICIIIFYIPDLQYLFSIFYRRTQEGFALGVGHAGRATRIGSFLFGAEQFGELIAVIYPLVLYKLITSVRSKQKIFAILFVILLIGAVMTGTRSINGLILFSTILLLLAKTGRLYKKKIVFLVSGIIITTLIILFFFSPITIFDILFERTTTTFNTLKTVKQMDTLFNREIVWPAAWSTTINTLSFFGHGPSQAAKLGITKHNFHSMYLSLIFQFGVIGFPLFAIFFSGLIIRLIRNIRTNSFIKYKLLCTCCLVSFLIFLVNEIKFEFNRGDSYQQLIFFVMAIIYLAAKVPSQSQNNE